MLSTRINEANLDLKLGNGELTTYKYDTSLVSLNVGKQRVFGSQHHTTDEDAQKDDVAVVRMIAQLVAENSKPQHTLLELTTICHCHSLVTGCAVAPALC